MILKFVLTILICLFNLSVYADLLIPQKLFAEKNEDTSKGNVFVWNGAQYSCDSPSPLYFKTKKEAQKLCGLCSNREVKQVSGGDESGHLKVNGKHYYSCEDENCLKCSEEGWCGGNLGHEEVKDVYACMPKSIKKCPLNKPQLDTFGFCHSCDEEKGIDVSWLEIEMINNNGKQEGIAKKGFVCDNRKLISVGVGQPEFYSVLYACSSKRPLKDYMGKCHSCDVTKAIVVEKGRYSATQFEDESCSNRKNMRFDEGLGYYTVFNIMKECPADKPLRDEHGGCHSCSEKKEIILDEKAVAFWGTIKHGKVYDADSKEVGKIVEATPFEKNGRKRLYMDVETKKFEPSFGIKYVWDMYNMKNEKVGSVTMEFHSVCTGDEICGNFYAKIYDLKGKLIAHGEGQHNGEDSKNNTSTYYWESISDRTCPNRKIYRKNIEEEWGFRVDQLVSGLKKETK